MPRPARRATASAPATRRRAASRRRGSGLGGACGGPPGRGLGELSIPLEQLGGLAGHVAQEHALPGGGARSEEHTSELQSPCNLVCRLLLEKKKKKAQQTSRPPAGRVHAPC